MTLPFTRTRLEQEQRLASPPARPGGRCVAVSRCCRRRDSRQLQSLVLLDLYGERHVAGVLRSVHRLSKITIVLGCHRTRAWKSWPLTMCCMRKSRSHFCSDSLSPCTFVRNSPFRNRHFSPVTGCTRISGWTVSTESLRTKPPVKRAWLIILADECTAVRLSRKERNVGESRLDDIVSTLPDCERTPSLTCMHGQSLRIQCLRPLLGPPATRASRNPAAESRSSHPGATAWLLSAGLGSAIFPLGSHRGG